MWCSDVSDDGACDPRTIPWKKTSQSRNEVQTWPAWKSVGMEIGLYINMLTALDVRGEQAQTRASHDKGHLGRHSVQGHVQACACVQHHQPIMNRQGMQSR